MRLGRSSKFVILIIVNQSVHSGCSVINLNLCEAVRGSDFRQIARLVWLRERSVLRVRSDSGIDQSVILFVASSRSYPLIQLVSGEVVVDRRRYIAALDH